MSAPPRVTGQAQSMPPTVLPMVVATLITSLSVDQKLLALAPPSASAAPPTWARCTGVACRGRLSGWWRSLAVFEPKVPILFILIPRDCVVVVLPDDCRLRGAVAAQPPRTLRHRLRARPLRP